MRRFVYAVRRHGFLVRLAWPKQLGRKEGDLDLSPLAARTAAVGLFDLSFHADRQNLSVDLGRHLPVLGNLILPPAEVWVLANDLFCCACRVLVKGTERIGGMVPVSVRNGKGPIPLGYLVAGDDPQPDQILHSIRLAGPGVEDLADLDSGDDQ